VRRYENRKEKEMKELITTYALMSIPVILLAAWLTHIFTCFDHSWWGYLIAGAIFFPIGILHGIYLWF